MVDMYNEGYDDGAKTARGELAPLVDAIRDVIFMFKDIEKARELPAFGNVVQQYIAMGKQLERLLELSKLEGTRR
jgi:hypothetical protein